MRYAPKFLVTISDAQDDKSVTGAALRETYEELGIPPENVEILGMLDKPEYSLGNRARVWPIVVSLHTRRSIPDPH
jgi:8-oxo-dGTP pyrophosphatase MutT (NUDIX family)